MAAANLNPTRCGTCGTENPPGQEFCIKCHTPLTITADAAVLDETPEDLDNPAQYDPDTADNTPSTILIGGAPIPVPTERIDPEPDRPPD